MIDPLLAIGFTLLGAGIGALVFFLYLKYWFNQFLKIQAKNQEDYFNLLKEIENAQNEEYKI